eukprot:6208200-Pleurochrysis_carterae.AAC.3
MHKAIVLLSARTLQHACLRATSRLCKCMSQSHKCANANKLRVQLMRTGRSEHFSGDRVPADRLRVGRLRTASSDMSGDR